MESAAGKSNSLRLLGKRTLAQGAVILDLGAESLPVLLEALTDRGRDWKVRYWAADMLGYVGDGQTAYVLMEVARDGKENGPVRVRAVESVAEIASRGGMEPERAREGLMRVARAANRELADKVSAAVKRLERLKPASSRAKPGPSR
ncbi:MAG: hypothetical protein A2902_06390 [Elusimicrobia bacterium RIFCSPLOWO2_01_FULL_64_13]|nr:MAG: hypothetical protein A2902_06390 [Elusimicrobia bacterium RIFCSPLOWO2_01_FULL_64_13]